MANCSLVKSRHHYMWAKRLYKRRAFIGSNCCKWRIVYSVN